MQDGKSLDSAWQHDGCRASVGTPFLIHSHVKKHPHILQLLYPCVFQFYAAQMPLFPSVGWSGKLGYHPPFDIHKYIRNILCIYIYMYKHIYICINIYIYIFVHIETMEFLNARRAMVRWCSARRGMRRFHPDGDHGTENWWRSLGSSHHHGWIHRCPKFPLVGWWK